MIKKLGALPVIGAVALFVLVGGVSAMTDGGGLFGGSSDDGPPAVEAPIEDEEGGSTPVGTSDDEGDEAETVDVKGEVLECATGEDTRFKFELEGDEFEVTGLLVSFDGSAVTVMGPDGDVSAGVTAETEVKDDPAAGDAVKVEGSVLSDGGFIAREIEPACDDEAEDVDEQDADDDDEDQDEVEVKGDVIACATGEDTRFKFELEGDEFEVTGLLVSFDGSAVTVMGPDGDVSAGVTAETEVEGEPAAGDAVKVEGSVLGDGSFVAREIEPACDAEDVDEPDVVHGDDDDDEDDGDEDGDDHDGDDDDDEDDDEDHGDEDDADEDRD